MAINPSEIARVNAWARTCKPRASAARYCASTVPVDFPKAPAASIRRRWSAIHVQPQQIGVELFPYRQEMPHEGCAYLTAQQPNEVSIPGDGCRLRQACH